MKTKKYAVLFLSVILAAFFAVPWNAAADETEKKELKSYPKTEQITDIFEDLPDNDELLEGYVNELFFDSYSMSVFGDFGEDRLEGIDLKGYNILKEKLGKVASGEAASSKITISLTDLGITKTEWTAADLGFTQINQETFNDAVTALRDQITPSLDNIFGYLLVDCPYDLYWFNKSGAGVAMTGWGVSGSTYDGKDYTLSVSSDLEYSFSVAEEYQDESAAFPTVTVKQSLTRPAAEAAQNAKKIVKKYEGYSDHDKLAAYRKEICSLVSYNYDAASNNPPYGNPWQMIWVFDGDPETEVVCEGYSKAFQYLCDMSDFFSPNIRCCTVTGVMDGGTGEGPHMWNIVTMDDRNNYIVDVTNCDGDSEEEQGRLFLVGAEGNVANGYAVVIGSGSYTQTITYEYSKGEKGSLNMPEMYGNILQISVADYQFPYVHSGGFGSGMEWTLDANGILNIKGAGDMPEPGDSMDYTAIPWYSYRGEIKRVVIEEGITSVASWAFLQIENIKELYLPEGLKSIQNASFAMSGIEKLVLPESLESVGMLAFGNCKSLAYLEIPAGVTEIAPGAFLDCSSLTDVKISPDNQSYEFSDGILYNKGKTVVWAALASKTGKVTLPGTVTEIGMYAFNSCRNITGIEIPDGVTEIGASAFDGCSKLMEMEIPGSVQRIGAEAFKDCSNLKDIWFLGGCPEFTDGGEGMDTAFDGDLLTLHYPETEQASWAQTAVAGFEGAEITFRVFCSESGHVWGEEYQTDKEATCTEDGIKSKRCTICGRLKEQAVILAGHSWEEDYTTDKAATCLEKGSESIHCKNCSETKDSREIPLAAHSLAKTGTGVNEHYACAVCGKTFRDAAGTTPFVFTQTNGETGGNPQDTTVKVSSISITSDASNKIAAGKKVVLSAEVKPENAANPVVIWESDNAKYAAVNSKGVVTTKKAGKGKTVTITASAADGSGTKASFKIKLMANAVTKIKIQNAKKTLKAGQTMKLKAEVSVNGKKANKKVKWMSSNPDYATVNAKGQVKAKPAGKNKTVTITVMSADGTKKKAKVKIRIN